MKRTFVIILVFIFCASMLAGQSNLTGRYVLSYMGTDEFNLMELFEMTGTEMDFYIELLPGNKFRQVMDDESGEGTYTVSGKTLTLKYDDEELKCIFEGNKITIIDEEETGMKMVYEKK